MSKKQKQMLILLTLLGLGFVPNVFAAGVLPPDIGGSFTDIRGDILTIGGGVILVALTLFGIRAVRSAAH